MGAKVGALATCAMPTRPGWSVLLKNSSSEAPPTTELAYDFAIVGDDEPVPLKDRREIADVVAEPNPAKRLAKYAAVTVGIDRRISAVWRALEGAAASDPEAHRLHAALVRQRRRTQR